MGLKINGQLAHWDGYEFGICDMMTGDVELCRDADEARHTTRYRRNAGRDVRAVFRARYVTPWGEVTGEQELRPASQA